MKPDTILPTFIKVCRANSDITILGKGQRIQNYIDVRDICHAVLRSIEKMDKYGVFNIANDKSYSNLELAYICKKVLGSKSDILFQGKDAFERYNWTISIEKAKKELEFTPKYTIEQSILDLI
jgi:UDP-glucose 4-epimerase